ncbi:MAG: C39 family peptidase [bacterium]
MTKFIKPTLLALAVVEIFFVLFLLYIYDKFVSDPQNYTSSVAVVRQAKKAGANILPDISETKTGLPKSFLIENVPFSVQSPDSLWDEYGEESCEEMSEIIVDHFWTKKALDRKIALVERNKLIEYEIQNYGDFRDENAAQIAQRLKDYFGYKKVGVIYDFSLQQLKEKIAQGKPIIVPAAGRKLGNPYFTQPGPLYHNLVIIGYEGTDIIVNDPGIGRGQGYRYNENVLYNAIHDFPGSKENIEQGRKAMIIVNGG